VSTKTHDNGLLHSFAQHEVHPLHKEQVQVQAEHRAVQAREASVHGYTTIAAMTMW
jgi:hypothetical protein